MKQKYIKERIVLSAFLLSASFGRKITPVKHQDGFDVIIQQEANLFHHVDHISGKKRKSATPTKNKERKINK